MLNGNLRQEESRWLTKEKLWKVCIFASLDGRNKAEELLNIQTSSKVIKLIEHAMISLDPINLLAHFNFQSSSIGKVKGKGKVVENEIKLIIIVMRIVMTLPIAPLTPLYDIFMALKLLKVGKLFEINDLTSFQDIQLVKIIIDFSRSVQDFTAKLDANFNLNFPSSFNRVSRKLSKESSKNFQSTWITREEQEKLTIKFKSMSSEYFAY